jgi:hypothetical protein
LRLRAKAKKNVGKKRSVNTLVVSYVKQVIIKEYIKLKIWI